MLDNDKLRTIFKKYAPDVDPDEEGIFAMTAAQPWDRERGVSPATTATTFKSTDTFVRMTEDFIKPELRTAYRMELERTFPGHKSGS